MGLISTVLKAVFIPLGFIIAIIALCFLIRLHKLKSKDEDGSGLEALSFPRANDPRLPTKPQAALTKPLQTVVVSSNDPYGQYYHTVSPMYEQDKKNLG
jgi:hypothetical protein